MFSGQASATDTPPHPTAGTVVLPRARLTVEREAVCHAALQRTLRVGEALLAADGDALDAKAARVCALGQEPRFNAGSGAVFAR